MITTAGPRTKKLANRIVQILLREGQSALVQRLVTDPTLLGQLLQHLRDAAQLIGSEVTTMNQTQEREIIRTLVAAGHEPLAKQFARSRGYRVAGANRLLGTSPSLEMMKKLIAEFWHSSPDQISYHENGDGTWSVIKSGKEMSSVIVKKKGKRYRFESV